MAEARNTDWFYSAIFVALALVLLFLRILPLGGAAGAWPGPDLLLCLMLAWVVQRPDHLPVLLIALVVLAEDLILMRPPGLWTALVVLGTEFLRSRSALTRELSFPAEWFMISAVIVAMTLANRMILAVAFLGQPGLGYVLTQTAGTILMYPVVVVLLRVAFNLRKPSTGEVDAMGRRI